MAQAGLRGSVRYGQADSERGSARPIRVLLVDDSLVARTVLARLLDSRPEFEIAGAAPTADQAIQFLTTDEINNSFVINSLKQFCVFFGRTPLNLDTYSDQQLLKEFNEPLNDIVYNNYIDQFLRYPGSQDKFFWEIYSDYMQQRLEK